MIDERIHQRKLGDEHDTFRKNNWKPVFEKRLKKRS